MSRGVDGDDPEEVLLRHSAGDLDAVDFRAVFFVFRSNAGNDRVDLRPLEITKRHINAAEGHGLLRHLCDGVSSRRVVTKEDVWQSREDHHRDHYKGNQNSQQYFQNKRKCFLDRDCCGAIHPGYRSSPDHAVGSPGGSGKISGRLEAGAGSILIIHASYPAVFGSPRRLHSFLHSP